ncbi:MAG: hypothetical protein Q8P59_05705, partial [Dehalococcoidia bacterium]|nr:hypothetical protein [Dehalococcoidia bacterium]
CGAELVGMELTQGPMFCVWDRRFYTPGASQFQCFGAKIINALGERIMEKYAPVGKEPLSDMALIGQAIIKETLEGRGPVYFDMRGWTDEQVAKLRKVLPGVMRAFDRAGINVQERPVESTPIVGLWDGAGEGGLQIGFDCQTNIPGLYAAGVAAQLSGSISSVVFEQAFANVSGYRAGENSAKTASRLEVPKLDERQIGRLQEQAFAPLRKKEGVSPDDIFKMAHQVVVPLENSMFKNEERINRVLSEVRRIAREEMPKISAGDAHDLVKANEARNFVSLAELVYCVARERKESRLNHWREDYPYRDDVDWLKWVIVRAGNTGPQIRIEPLPLERYPFQPPERARIPAAVQFSFKEVTE